MADPINAEGPGLITEAFGSRGIQFELYSYI